MVHSVTPSLGFDDTLQAPLGYWDASVPSPQLGSALHTSDGHVYILVEAGAALAAGVDVVIAESTFVATAGVGEYQVPAALTAVILGDVFWAQKIVIG